MPFIARCLLLLVLPVLPGCSSSDPPPPVASTPTPRDADLEPLKNRAIAHLENEDHAKADELLQSLARKAPDERLPVRDLTICRLLALDGAKPDRAAALQAMETLLAKEPDSTAAAVLAARILRHPTGQSAPTAAAHADRAFGLLEAAARRSPDDPAVHWELFEAGERESGPRRERALVALKRVHELLPDNLAVAIRRMGVLAEAKDAEVLATLDALKTRAGPIQVGLQKMGQDIQQLLDEAKAAAEKQDWGEVEFRAMALTNITRSDTFVQGDSKRVEAHPFAFLLTRFDAAAPAAATPPPPPLEVTFVQGAAIPAPGAVHLRGRDFDLDGAAELVALTPQALEVHRPGGGAPESRLPLDPGMTGFAIADLDRDTLSAQGATPATTAACQDADPDVVVHGAPGLLVLRNHLDPATGTRSLTKVDQPMEIRQITGITAAVLADVDHDSDLDLVIAAGDGTHVLSHAGDLVFEDVTRFSELGGAAPVPLQAVDRDRDVDLDVIGVTRTPPALGILENRLHQRFRWVPLPPAPVGEVRAAIALEADGNGSWDLVVSGTKGLALVPTSSPGGGRVESHEPVAISPEPADGLVCTDLDNDGRLDLVSWAAGRASLWRGLGGSFERADRLPATTGVTSVTPADVDGDGDPDLLAATAATVEIWTNQGGEEHPWIDLRLLGRADNRDRANHHGLGTLVEVRTGRGYQARVVEGPSTLIGLGPDPGEAMVRLLWPSGTSQWMIDARPRAVTCEPMVLKGSCPYLYTWDGRHFRFVTDLLWSAPLGLRAPDGSIVPPRSWEWLKIPGDALVEEQGRLSLRITEELWEACYFDHVELIAVDHPAGVEIHTNEKVGPPALAAPRLFTVSEKLHPRTAIDGQGRDLLPDLAAADGRFARPFTRRLRQGYTEPSVLDLDLGSLEDPSRVILFLTGWIHPADSSLAMDFAQDPAVAGPEPPKLQVPDGSGGWRTISSYCGFPGGKTKTIALDLSGQLDPEDPRVRMVTSSELCWDEIFFTVNEPEVPVVRHALALQRAGLTYRGYSRRVEGPPDGPESYDFADVDPAPRWPPMTGGFTRHGEVLDLLTSGDDALVVMASGDELALEFASAPPPPPGHVRDYLLHSIGWDKDADLNTVHGQSAGPLPCQAMTGYPPLDPPALRTAEARALASRATRRPDGSFWRRSLR